MIAAKKKLHDKKADAAADARRGKSEIPRKVQPAGRVQAPRHDTPRGQRGPK